MDVYDTHSVKEIVLKLGRGWAARHPIGTLSSIYRQADWKWEDR